MYVYMCVCVCVCIYIYIYILSCKVLTVCLAATIIHNCLLQLLQYLGHTSPECLESLDTPRNIPAPPPPPLTREVEEDTITMVLNQRNAEQEYLQRHSADTMYEIYIFGFLCRVTILHFCI